MADEPSAKRIKISDTVDNVEPPNKTDLEVKAQPAPNPAPAPKQRTATNVVLCVTYVGTRYQGLQQYACY